MPLEHPNHRPRLEAFAQWTYADYISYFLSAKAMKARLRGEPSPAALLDEKDFARFCAPIRERIQALFGSSDRPRVSIIAPAFNEEPELLPSLVSFTCLQVEPGVAELVMADNASTDHTARIIQNCGVRYVYCGTPGVGYCRQAAYRSIAPSAEYVWLTDADTRMVAPLAKTEADAPRSTILQTNLHYLEEHPDVIGISTGSIIEGAHPLYHLIHDALVLAGKTKRISCWAGVNQFVRRWALDEIGGIDVDVEFGDDQHRQFQLARLGKRLKKKMECANTNGALIDPVYTSGRRYGTLSLLVRHYFEAATRKPLPRDQYGFPVHTKGQQWRLIRK